MFTLPVCCSSFGVQQRVLGFYVISLLLMYFDNKDD